MGGVYYHPDMPAASLSHARCSDFLTAISTVTRFYDSRQTNKKHVRYRVLSSFAKRAPLFTTYSTIMLLILILILILAYEMPPFTHARPIQRLGAIEYERVCGHNKTLPVTCNVVHSPASRQVLHRTMYYASIFFVLSVTARDPPRPHANQSL